MAALVLSKARVTITFRILTTPPSRFTDGIRLARNMSEKSRLLAAVESCFPKLTYDKHKGQAGRIAVIGGSQEYTGAPYFAAISALKLGADISHVFCKAQAGGVIKSYSPELIVHPILDNEDFITEFEDCWLPRFHAVVVGPGLGRDEKFQGTFRKILTLLAKSDIPVVIDADGLYYLSVGGERLLDIIRGKRHVILTPNVNEMSLLYKALGIDHGGGAVGSDERKDSECVAAFCINMGSVSVVHKGRSDIISNGEHVLVCDVPGSPRRCGGQGDLLSGSLALLAHWARDAARNNTSNNAHLLRYGPNMCAAYGACALTRHCNNLAFGDLGRSTTTTDMINVIHRASKMLFNDE